VTSIDRERGHSPMAFGAGRGSEPSRWAAVSRAGTAMLRGAVPGTFRAGLLAPAGMCSWPCPGKGWWPQCLCHLPPSRCWPLSLLSPSTRL